MDEQTDGQLLSRFFTEGDENAFRVLLERYQESLTLFLYGFVHNMEDAEELMLDSFAIIASGTAKYSARTGSTFKTWLYAVGRNRARMFLRKRKLFFLSLDEKVEVPSEPLETAMFLEEQKQQLYRGLSRLKEDYRQALYLAYFEDMKPEEIGRVMKKNVKQVYNLLARGKKVLRETLERMGVDYVW